MSSSSALMIAVFLGLDAASGGRVREAIRDVVTTVPQLAEYLACIENGASYGRLTGELGVGTAGGSQDHTAILCSRAGELRRYRYAPYAQEGGWGFPSEYGIVVAASGVIAEKTGAAREAYNRASRLAREATTRWSRLTGRPARHLADVVASDPAADELLAGAGPEGSNASDGTGVVAGDLAGRVRAFTTEMDAVDRAGRALGAGDLEAFALAVRDSQYATEHLLGNQVPETIHLAASAERHGALAASAFGAGFGGAVWAMVPESTADRFIEGWSAEYREAFPEPAARATFVRETPGPGASRQDGEAIW